MPDVYLCNLIKQVNICSFFRLCKKNIDINKAGVDVEESICSSTCEGADEEILSRLMMWEVETIGLP